MKSFLIVLATFVSVFFVTQAARISTDQLDIGRASPTPSSADKIIQFGANAVDHGCVMFDYSETEMQVSDDCSTYSAILREDEDQFWSRAGTTISTKTANDILELDTILKLNGTTSGYIQIQAGSAPTPITYTLPSADGSADQVLTTNGSGSLSWEDASGIGTGEKNYLTELTASSFTAYKNTSAANKPDDFGGSPSGDLAISDSASTPLRGANSILIAKSNGNDNQG
jgi:hypothetical protein